MQIVSHFSEESLKSVGLCQEGAMEMGRRGFRYGEIISFYYKAVNQVSVTTIQIKIPEFD